MPGGDPNIGPPPATDMVMSTAPATSHVSSSGSRVQVTPHRLVVILLIKEYCHLKVSVPILAKEKTNTSLLILSLVQSPDLDLNTICSKIREKIELSDLVSAWARGVARLQEEGVAGVMDLVQTSVEKLLTADNYPINRSSVIGLLLRQVFLSFDKLTFSEVSSLKQQFDQYYMAGRTAVKKLAECTTNDGESFEMSLESNDNDTSKSDYVYVLPNSLPQEFVSDQQEEDQTPCGVSRKQADLFLAQQAAVMQTNENEALSPQDLQAELTRILKSCPGLAEAHFLSYLNCLRVKDVSQAVHSLYGSCNQQEESLGAKFNQEDGSKGFRFAALNLASYHVKMNHKSEAMSAIKEAITMAQEASDHTCLQHVLTLLHTIVEDKDKQRLMERCVSKCSELNLTYLTSLSLLSLATHMASGYATGTRAEVCHVLELVARSDLINCQHSIQELQSTSTMVKCSVWSVYGRPGIAFTLAQIALQQLQLSGESAALALVNIVMYLDIMAMSDKADKVMKVAEKLFSAKYSQWGHIISEVKDRLSVRRSLINQDCSRALTTVNRMKATKVPDAQILEAQTLLKQGRIVECREAVQTILSTDTNKKPELHIRALLLLSDIFNLSGSPVYAVEYIIQAIDICKKNRKDLLLHISLLHLANCHMLMSFPHKGLSVTMASLPFILAHGGIEESAKAWLLAAKCKIGTSKDENASQKRILVLEGADLVTKAKDLFCSIGDNYRVQDCLYLLARLYHSLQLTHERNIAASQYKKLEDLYPVKSRITVQCLL